MTLTQAIVWFLCTTVFVGTLMVLGIYRATSVYNRDREHDRHE